MRLGRPARRQPWAAWWGEDQRLSLLTDEAEPALAFHLAVPELEPERSEAAVETGVARRSIEPPTDPSAIYR